MMHDLRCSVFWKLYKLNAENETLFKNSRELLGTVLPPNSLIICGQSYKVSAIVSYDSRVVPDLKIPHISTQDS